MMKKRKVVKMEEAPKASRFLLSGESELDYQKIVDEIFLRAMSSRYGCGNPDNSLILESFTGENSADAAARTIINAFRDKYDLVSLLQAAIELGVDSTQKLRDKNDETMQKLTKAKRIIADFVWPKDVTAEQSREIRIHAAKFAGCTIPIFSDQATENVSRALNEQN
jgi:hypothetical protein